MPPSRTLSNSSTAFSPFRQAIRGAPQNRRTRSTCAASANPIWAASWLASPPTSRPPIALGCPVNDSGPIPGRHAGEPLLDIHPTDAERLGLVEGGLARIESRHGAAVLPVRLSADQRAGEVFAPMHWTDRFTSAGPIGRLVGAATDPISGQPELKATPVRMEAVTVMWRGILLRRTEVALSDGPYYWARLPLATGHAFSLAGWKPLPTGRESESWIANLLDARDDTERVIYADPGRGTFRYASIVRGRLDACLLLAGDAAALPPHDALAALIGAKIVDEGRTCLLAAGLRPDAGKGDPGGTVCACFS